MKAHGDGERVRLVELRDVLYLPDVLEEGQSLCVAGRGFVPAESVLDCSSIEYFKNAWQQRAGDDRTGPRTAEPHEFSGRACVVGNLFSRNFGHWTEELLKVAVLEDELTDCCYVFSHLPRFAREFLDLLGVDDHRIVPVTGPMLLRRAVFTTSVHHENLARYPGPLHSLRARLDQRLAGAQSRYAERLWLERGVGVRNGGTTLNKDEVYRCLEGRGFDILDPATLPVAEQVVTMRSARLIAGSHGAQFVHAQFMPERSSVIECFSPMFVNPSILQMCRVLEHSYQQVVSRNHFIAPYPHGRDCVVDCEHLALLLDRLSCQVQ